MLALDMILSYNKYRRVTSMKKPFSITVEESIYDAIKSEAEKEGRTISNFIEFILRQYLADRR